MTWTARALLIAMTLGIAAPAVANDTLDGTFVLDPEEWDEIGTGLYVTFDAGGTTGEIDEYGAKLDVQENPIEQTWETVATWPPAG